MKPFTILSSELQEFILSQGVPHEAIQFMRDSEYVLPTERWITDVFGPWFQAKIVAEGYTYRTHSRDCDKFTRRAASLAGDCNAVTEERAGNVIDELGQSMSPTYGLAFGEVWVKTPLHAINAVVHRNNGQLQLVGYEPQPSYGNGVMLDKISMRVVEMNRKDWETCKRFDI